jgi:hypothetical protein
VREERETATDAPAFEVALTWNGLASYITLAGTGKVIICDCRGVDPCGRIVNDPDTGVAAL